MQRKKIVHLISSLKIGGAESLLHDLVIGLGFEQYEHHVICFHTGPNADRLAQAGAFVYQPQGFLCRYDPIFFWRVWRCIKKIRPDILHTALWAANFVGRIMGRLQKIPVVCAVHLGVDLDGRLRNALDRFTFRYAAAVIAVSDVVAATLKERSSWVPAKKIVVIKNGIDAASVRARATQQAVTRKDLGLTDEHVVVGAVGRFVPRKNFDLLIDSFASVARDQEQARLVLVGLGPQEDFLRQKARDCGVADKVIFVVGKSAYGYYPLFDLFVLPSAQEGLSIALLEAICFGLPCIVTSSTGHHEVIADGETGCVVQPHDLEQLTVALRCLLSSRELRDEMHKKTDENLKNNFSFSVMVNSYKNAFGGVTK